MNINLSLTLFKKMIVTFLHRYHVLIFVFIVVNGSIIVILLLNSNIISSGRAAESSPITDSTTFDTATIKRIEELKSRNQASSNLDLSQGRTNPFVE
jgi:hypothetical protein